MLGDGKPIGGALGFGEESPRGLRTQAQEQTLIESSASVLRGSLADPDWTWSFLCVCMTLDLEFSL